MVRRVIHIVYKEVRGLHQAAYVLAFFAFGSQLLALVRDRMLAHQFGAGYDLDLYYAAFRIPDLLYVLFASTLSVYVLIPFVARAREGLGGDVAAQKVLSQVFTVFLCVYTLLALGIMFAAPYLVTIFFPAFADDQTIVLLLRIMLLQPFFLGVSSLFGVVTQLGHRFVLFAISPLVYNLGIIFGIVALYPLFGLAGLAYGVVIGAIGHMLIQLPLVRQSPLSFFITRHVSWKDIRAILAVSIPRAFTLSLNQLVMLVFVSIATGMAVGSVSVYQFAYNLQSVPLAVIGVSYSVAAFPMLAELHAQKKFNQFNLYIGSALRHVIFWSLPVIALIIVLRAQLVRVVLGSGAFDWSDTRLTAAVLALFSISLLAQAVNLIAIRAFYAGSKTRIPLLTALTGAVVSVAIAFVLLQLYHTSDTFRYVLTDLLRVDTVPGSEVLVLGLSYAIGVFVQACLLLVLLARSYAFSLRTFTVPLFRALFAATCAGLAAYTTLNFIVVGINPARFLGIFIQGLIAGLVGVLFAIIAYALLRSPELTEVAGSFQKKLFKTKLPASDEEII